MFYQVGNTFDTFVRPQGEEHHMQMYFCLFIRKPIRAPLNKILFNMQLPKDFL